MIGMDKIDLNNPEFAGWLSPDANWKRALLVRLARLFNLPTLVETGTCWGDTIHNVREDFKEIWSVELSPVFYESARKKFEGDPHIHLFLGSSGNVLPVMINQTTGPLLFWLDAHPTGQESADDGEQTTKELAAILSMRPDSLVLIDDVKPGKNGGFEAPDISTIPVPQGWQTRFISGVLALHAGGYDIPEKF